MLMMFAGATNPGIQLYMDFSTHERAPSIEIMIHRFNSRAKYGSSIKAKITMHHLLSTLTPRSGQGGCGLGNENKVFKKNERKKWLFYFL